MSENPEYRGQSSSKWMYSTLMSPETSWWFFSSRRCGCIRADRFFYGIIRLSISSAFHPSKQTQSGDAVSRAECCLPSWLCHMLFGGGASAWGTICPYGGRKYTHSGAAKHDRGGIRVPRSRCRRKKKKKNKQRDYKSPQDKQQRGDENEKHRNWSAGRITRHTAMCLFCPAAN